MLELNVNISESVSTSAYFAEQIEQIVSVALENGFYFWRSKEWYQLRILSKTPDRWVLLEGLIHGLMGSPKGREIIIYGLEKHSSSPSGDTNSALWTLFSNYILRYPHKKGLEAFYKKFLWTGLNLQISHRDGLYVHSGDLETLAAIVEYDVELFASSVKAIASVPSNNWAGPLFILWFVKHKTLPLEWILQAYAGLDEPMRMKFYHFRSENLSGYLSLKDILLEAATISSPEYPEVWLEKLFDSV